MKAICNIITIVAVVSGIAAIATGIVTATAHNIVIGIMFIAAGYANYYEEKQAK